MKYKVYSLYDSVANEYLAPTIEPSDAVVRRSVENALAKNDSLLATHAKDFSMRVVGEWDSELGILTPQQPYTVFNVSALVKE